MSRFWLIVSIPAAVLAVWLLVKTGMGLLHMVRGSVVATVPIVAEQQVVFNEGGSFTLNWESPLAARRGVSLSKTLPEGLTYSLTRVDPPYAVPLFITRSQIYVNSMTRSRMQIISFAIPNGGPYTLHIGNIDKFGDYGKFAVVVSRPIGAKLVMYILALLVLAFASIGSIVVTGLLINGKSLSNGAGF